MKEIVVRATMVRLSFHALSLISRAIYVSVISRLLSPEDFGLVAMVTALATLIGVFSNAGLGNAMVQANNATEEHLSTMFWLGLIICTCFGILFALIAPLIAWFYGDQRTFAIALVLAPTFVIGGLTAQLHAIMARRLRFDVVAGIDYLSHLATVVVAICLAAVGCGYWALVGSIYAGGVCSLLCLSISTRWRPGRPRWGNETVAMVRFGKMITVNELLRALCGNIEQVLLGRFGDAVMLGYYNRAVQILSLAVGPLGRTAEVVASSALARLQDEPEKLKANFLAGYAAWVAFIFPVIAILVLCADPFVNILLGSMWGETTVLLRWLAPGLLAASIMLPLNWYLFAIGKPGRIASLTVMQACFMLPAYGLAVPYGAYGMAIANSLSLSLLIVPFFLFVTRGTSLKPAELLFSSRDPAAASGIACVAVLSASNFMTRPSSDVGNLLQGSIIAGIVYGIVFLFVFGNWRRYADLVHVLRAPLR